MEGGGTKRRITTSGTNGDRTGQRPSTDDEINGPERGVQERGAAMQPQHGHVLVNETTSYHRCQSASTVPPPDISQGLQQIPRIDISRSETSQCRRRRERKRINKETKQIHKNTVVRNHIPREVPLQLLFLFVFDFGLFFCTHSSH